MERENLRKETEKYITEETLKERLDLINRSQSKYNYELVVDKGAILEYGINIKNRAGYILATRMFYDKIELLSHIRGMEEIIKYL